MRFALLGLDDDTRRLAAFITEGGTDQIGLISAPAGMLPEMRRIAPGAKTADGWEDLLVGDGIDAVIFSRGGDQDVSADQLRKLIQADVPLVASHPAHPSMLVCYELEMIRQETGCRVMSFSAARLSAAFEYLLSVAIGTHPQLGPIEQVMIERWLDDRSPDRVRELFAQDMDLARPLVGELTRLAALAPTSESVGYANLGVQLSGPSGALVRWSGGPIEQAAGARVTVVGALGRAVLDMPTAGTAWRVEVRGDRPTTTKEFSSSDQSLAVTRIRQFAAGQAAEPTWRDACRAVELADSIQRSLEKGRTVELHYEDYTEQATFKGTMTSLGCGLLWGALVILVLGVVAAGFHLRVADYWPQLVLVVLSLFLLLQLLRFVFPRGQSGSSNEEH